MLKPRGRLRVIRWGHEVRPIIGAPMTIRTLHPFDRRREAIRAQARGDGRPPFTLDGLITVTMPLIMFGGHTGEAHAQD